MWDTSDLNEVDDAHRPIFFVRDRQDPDNIQSVLTRGEPWLKWTQVGSSLSIASFSGAVTR